VVPPAYEFKALLNPKIGPNSLVEFKTDTVRTTALVDSVKFSGNNYGGDYTVSGHCTQWTGPGDTYTKAST
jgi:hypothetical protein